MSKNKLLYLGKWLAIFALLYIFCLAKINDEITPFGIALAFSFLPIIKKSYIIAPLYFLASFLVDFSMQNIIINSVSAGVLLLFSIFLINKRINIFYTIPVMLVSLSGFTYYQILENNLANCVISLVASCIALVIFSQFLKAIMLRPFVFKLTLDESVCGSLMIIVGSCGLASLPLTSINIGYVLSVFLLLLAVYTMDKNHAITFACLLGVGVAIATNEITYIAIYTLMSIVSLAFKNRQKIYSIFGIIAIDLIFGLYFQSFEYTIISGMQTLIGCTMFLLISNDKIEQIYAYFCSFHTKFASRDIVNRSRNNIYQKLLELSGIFSEMDTAFRQMIRGQMTRDEAIKMLVEDTCQKVCENCAHHSKCHRGNFDTNQILTDLFKIGFERGKTTLLDIPPFLSSNCTKVNQLLSSVNQSLNKYKQYSGMINNLDSSRILIAEQLNGVSRICKNLGIKVNQKLSFDNTKENMLLEELTYNNIITSEVLIYRSDTNNVEISLVLRNTDLQSDKFIKITEQIVKTPLTLTQITPAEVGGWSIATLTNSAKYDIVFGYAGTAKTGEEFSGDNYSLLRLGENKFMMAICDGMGSGEKARKTSELAINLIENFYKAGFDNDIILSSVNKLLALNQEETFTALDMCIIDLNSSFADFIKLGATIGFIKHQDTTEIIETNSLPIGILEQMSPKIHKMILQDKDIVILCSDGVVDAFENQQILKNLINDTQTLHPQLLADKILDTAFSQKAFASDDMSILVGRIFKKR